MEQHRMASAFFPGLIEAIQKLCQESLLFNHFVELSGYLCLDIDSTQKERYVVSELVHCTGSIVSESFCAKVFRTAALKKPQTNQAVQTVLLSQDKITEACSSDPQVCFSAGMSSLSTLVPLKFSAHEDTKEHSTEIRHIQLVKRQQAICEGIEENHTGQIVSKKVQGNKGDVDCNILKTQPENSFPFHKLQKHHSFSPFSSSHPDSSEVTLMEKESARDCETTSFPIKKQNSSLYPDCFANFTVVKVENEEDQSVVLIDEHSSEAADFHNSVFKKRRLDAVGLTEGATQSGFVPPYSSTITSIGDTSFCLPTDASSYRSVSGMKLATITSSGQKTEPAEEENAISSNKDVDSFRGTGDDSLSPSADSTEYVDISYETDESYDETSVEEGNTYHMSGSFSGEPFACFDGQDNENKHTQRKTIAHVKLLQTFLDQTGEVRQFHTIPPQELDPILGNFLVNVKKDNGEDYEPNYLRNIQSSLERYLRAEGYGYSITRDRSFENSRRLLKCKQEILMKQGLGKFPRRPAPITDHDVEILYQRGQLGIETPDALLNSLWWCNTVYFGIKGTRNHHSLKWGDIVLGLSEDGQEYLEYIGSASIISRYNSNSPLGVYAKTDNTSRCPVFQFKLYSQHRPSDFCRPGDPFYLAVNYFHPTESWFKRQQIGLNKMGNILKKMAVGAGLPQEKRLTNISARKHMAIKQNCFSDGHSFL